VSAKGRELSSLGLSRPCGCETWCMCMCSVRLHRCEQKLTEAQANSSTTLAMKDAELLVARSELSQSKEREARCLSQLQELQIYSQERKWFQVLPIYLNPFLLSTTIAHLAMVSW